MCVRVAEYGECMSDIAWPTAGDSRTRLDSCCWSRGWDVTSWCGAEFGEITRSRTVLVMPGYTHGVKTAISLPDPLFARIEDAAT